MQFTGHNPKGLEKGLRRSFRDRGLIDSVPSVQDAEHTGTDPNTKMNCKGFRCTLGMKDGMREQQSDAKPSKLVSDKLAL